jgi:hypothetical protein
MLDSFLSPKLPVGPRLLSARCDMASVINGGGRAAASSGAPAWTPSPRVRFLRGVGARTAQCQWAMGDRGFPDTRRERSVDRGGKHGVVGNAEGRRAPGDRDAALPVQPIAGPRRFPRELEPPGEDHGLEPSWASNRVAKPSAPAAGGLAPGPSRAFQPQLLGHGGLTQAQLMVVLSVIWPE